MGSGESWQLRRWGWWDLAELSPSCPRGRFARGAAPMAGSLRGKRRGRRGFQEPFDNACRGGSHPLFSGRAGFAGLIFGCLGHGEDAVRSEEPRGHQVVFPGRGRPRWAG